MILRNQAARLIFISTMQSRQILCAAVVQHMAGLVDGLDVASGGELSVGS